MLNVIGQVKVTNIKKESFKSNDEIRERVTATVYQPVKVGKNFKGDDKWENEFVNCRFVGEALPKTNTIVDKDKIEITASLLRARNYKGKTYFEIVIFDFVKCDDIFDPNNEPIQGEEAPF